MEQLTFTQCGTELSVEQLTALEDQLGCKLPRDYRGFLLKHNGGYPSRGSFETKTGGIDYLTWVDYFHSVDENLGRACEDAEYNTISFNHFQYGTVVPKNCLIIGTVARDNLLLLRIHGKDRGRVDQKIMGTYGMPNSSEWEAEPESDVYPVANSFSDFLKMLRADE